MRTGLLATASAAFLAGCGDPLSGVEKLSDVQLAEGQPVREAVASPEETGRTGGLLARLLNPDGAENDGVRVATRGRDTTVTSTRAQPNRITHGRGDKARRSVAATDKAQDVPYGAVLPFATVGRVCDARDRAKGRRIETSDAGYDLYDTAPTSVHPRTFYVTGFADGCPRQFTAALAMFGAPSMHEQLRYGRPSDDYPYSDTDRAYEKVKSAICGAARRKPCGSRIGALERNTVFISTYERFSSNGRWADILVHDGAVLAASLKDP